MTFKEALTIIKVSMERTVVAAVKSLKSHTFKVEVTNPSKGASSAKPQELEKHLKQANQYLQEMARSIEGLKPTSAISEVKVKEPIDLSSKSLAAVLAVLQRFQAPQTDSPLSNDPKKYIPVRLTDGETFYKALQELAVAGGRSYAYSNSQGAKQQALVDADRHPQVDVLSLPAINVTGSDALAKYHIADKDDDAEPNYYGYTDTEGNWYILKEESSAYRYAAGASGYAGNWTNRATLTYHYLYDAF